MRGYGGMYGGGGGDPVQVENLKAAAENYRTDVGAGAEQDKAARAQGSLTGTGTLTHYNPDRAATIAKDRGVGLATVAGSVGEPTSYAGGHPIDASGNPQPGLNPSIGVIRGMKQTYAVDAGGPQLTEAATPLQAAQLINQAKGVGEFNPAGTAIEGQKVEGDLARAAIQGPNITGAAAAPGIAADAAAKVRAENQLRYAAALPGKIGHGMEQDKTGKWVPSTDKDFLTAHNKYWAQAAEDPEGAIAGMTKEYGGIQQTRENNTLYDKHGSAAINLLPVPQSTKNALLSGTPEAKQRAMPYIQQYLGKQQNTDKQTTFPPVG